MTVIVVNTSPAPTSGSRIGYRNLLEQGSVVASSENPAYPVLNCFDGNSSDFFQPAAGGTTTITLTLASGAAANYFAFYGQDIYAQGGTIKLQYFNGTDWVDATGAAPADNAAVMLFFDSVTAEQWRVVVTTALPFNLACVSFGEYLELPRGQYLGWTPPIFARDAQLINSVSDRGSFLGRSVLDRGVSFNMVLQYAPDAWMRENWLPFVAHIEEKAFFFCPDYNNQAADVAWCWVENDVAKPSHTHYGFMGVNIPLPGENGVSFDELRVKVGRRPVTIVEIDVDSCANVYGSAPCTAVLGTSGTQKCFNTFHTCQDRANFSKVTKTYRFCDDGALIPVGDGAIPCILSTDIAPTQLDPKGLSVSASVTVTFKDFPHHDRGTDPYYAERDYEAMGQGSFWGKFRGRNPFLVNRPLRVITGYIGADGVVYGRTRNYFIKSMEGPDANGVVRLNGSDILRFSEKDGASVPVASTGILTASVTNSGASLALSPAGVGSEYPTAGRVRIGDELIDYTGKSTDTLTGCTRGVEGTTAEAHDASAKVQLCTVFDGETVDEVITTLLTDYASIDASYIPSADWAAENSDWLGSFTCHVTLSDPADVKDIVKEVLLASGSVLWWDEIEAELKWKVIAPLQPSGEVRLLDETTHILAGSLKVKDLEKDRISRVFMYLDQLSAIGDVDRKAFRTVSALVDVDSESANAYDAAKLLEIYNRWIPNSLPLADEINNRYLVRYVTTPRQVDFKLDAKDFTIKTGDIVDVLSRLLQLPDGSAGSVRFLVTECKEAPIGSQAQYSAIQIYPVGGGQSWLIAADAQADWGSATDLEKETYMFISDDAGVMPDLVKGPLIG